MSLLVALALAAAAPARDPVFDEAWACTSRTDANGIRVDVIRTLDAKGRQLNASLQWFADGVGPEALKLWGISEREGNGDPPAFDELLVSSENGQNNPEAPSWRLMLQRPGQDPVQSFAFSAAPAGATVPWRPISRLLRTGSTVRLSLVDSSGRPIATADIEPGWHAMLKQRIDTAMRDTSAMREDFERRCEPVTEWMRF